MGGGLRNTARADPVSEGETGRAFSHENGIRTRDKMRRAPLISRGASWVAWGYRVRTSVPRTRALHVTTAQGVISGALASRLSLSGLRRFTELLKFSNIC